MRLKGAAEAVARYHMKEENYYFAQSKDGEHGAADGSDAQSHVTIHGELAGLLGYAEGDRITEREFVNLLTTRARDGRQVGREHEMIGIDLTFSAPKSLSVAALLTVRDPKILEAHDQAVLETLREIEANCTGTQKKVSGENHHVRADGMAYVTVRDGYNRDHEPHVHTHTVIANMTLYEGKVMALDGKLIYARDFNKLWGAMYRSKLAAKMKDLGYSLTYLKNGEWRLDCVSIEVEKAFSGRREAIKAAKDRGLRDMEAWRATRQDKDPAILKGNIREAWRKTLERFGEKTAQQNRRETIAAREQWTKDAKYSVEARQELAGEVRAGEIGRWQAAARRATESMACVSAEAIMTEYETELMRTEKWADTGFDELRARFEAQVREGHILKTEEGYYTTWEMARVDRECVGQWATVEALKMSEAVAAEELAKYNGAQKAKNHRQLSEVQLEAAKGILTASEGLVVVQGDAGAGKTTMLRGIKEVAAGAGWDVVGMAIQGVAARNLEAESGIKSVTLAAYLAQQRSSGDVGEPARRPRIVVLDEGSMLGSRDQAELSRLAADRGDKLVLVGDRNQIQSIGAGKPFDRLVAVREASGDLLNLDENFRQRGELRRAVKLARDGDMRGSLDIINRKGWVRQIEDKVLRREAIARLYDDRTLILAGTKESQEDLNKRIRTRLLARGGLDTKTEREYAVGWEDKDGVRQAAFRRFAEGDRVALLKNEYKHYDLRNGERATVLKTEANRMLLQLEDGRRVDVDLSRYNALDYGYAITTYKSQGQTFDKVVVDADTAISLLQDQRNCYVQITRARDEVRIFTDDESQLVENAGILSVKRDTHDMDVGVSQAREREAWLKERAHAEALEKVAEAQILGREAAKSLQLAAGQTEEAAAGPARINNEKLLEAANGVEIFKNILLKHSDALEKRLNEREDLDSAAKLRIAGFFSQPEAALLLSGSAESPDMKISGVAIELGLRSKDDIGRGLAKKELAGIEYCAGLAAAVEKTRERERSRGRDGPSDQRGFFR